MDVKTITLQYLKANDFDGLQNGDGCGCRNDDLFPCQCIGVEGCTPGYLVNDDSDEWDFLIVAEKPKKETPCAHK